MYAITFHFQFWQSNNLAPSHPTLLQGGGLLLERGAFLGWGGMPPPPPRAMKLELAWNQALSNYSTYDRELLAGMLVLCSLSLTTSAMAFVTDNNRPHPLPQPPPTAGLTASEATSEVLSVPIHPCPPPPAPQVPPLQKEPCPAPLFPWPGGSLLGGSHIGWRPRSFRRAAIRWGGRGGKGLIYLYTAVYR